MWVEGEKGENCDRNTKIIQANWLRRFTRMKWNTFTFMEHNTVLLLFKYLLMHRRRLIRDIISSCLVKKIQLKFFLKPASFFSLNLQQEYLTSDYWFSFKKEKILFACNLSDEIDFFFFSWNKSELISFHLIRCSTQQNTFFSCLIFVLVVSNFKFP